jgi:hypothetical protein
MAAFYTKKPIPTLVYFLPMAGGHGHEAPHGHESPGSHNEWMKHALNGLIAFGIGEGVATYGTAIMQAATIALAPWMGWIGLGAAAWFLTKRYSGGGHAAHGHAGGHGHH